MLLPPIHVRRVANREAEVLPQADVAGTRGEDVEQGGGDRGAGAVAGDEARGGADVRGCLAELEEEEGGEAEGEGCDAGLYSRQQLRTVHCIMQRYSGMKVSGSY